MTDEYPFDHIQPKARCPDCGWDATVNIHTDQGQILDFFYECECGTIFEDKERC